MRLIDNSTKLEEILTYPVHKRIWLVDFV